MAEDGIGNETAREPLTEEQRIPPVAEVLGYVGGALALAAVIALVSTFWREIGVWGRVGIAGLLGIAGFAGGLAFGRVKGAAAHRLSECLYVVGTAGAACAVGFAVRDAVLNLLSPPMAVGRAVAEGNDWAWFAGFAVVALCGAILWWRRHTVIRHLVFGFGVALATLLALPLLPIEGPEWGAGLTLALVGVAWGALGLRDLIPPQDAALTLAPLGILGGVQMMTITEGAEGPVWALWLGLAVSLALVAAGSALRKLQVLGIAAVGVALFAFQLLDRYMGESIAMPAALIAGGFVLLGVGAWLLLRERPAEKRASTVVAELAGYVGIGLAVAGGGMLVGEFGDELGVAGRIIVPAIGVVVGYGVGLALDRRESGHARRLSQVLLGIGSIAFGLMSAMIAKPVLDARFPGPISDFDYAGAWTFVAGTAGATLAAGITWWLRKGPMTLVVFAGSVSMLIGAVSSVQPMTPPIYAGVALFAVGVLWLLLGLFERTEPANTAMVMGCISIIMGLQTAAQNPEGKPYAAVMVFAIAVAIAEIIASIVLKRGILLGFGAVGVVMFSFAWIMETFAGQIGAPIALLIAGVIFIAMAVVVAVLLPKMRAKQPGHGSGPTGAVPVG